ncbi:MAG: hypothetical protein JW841_17615 [Deltaproteobacteria bacterium]|nr:hypothetical protein [Deltaproteobacteria bacterium]
MIFCNCISANIDNDQVTITWTTSNNGTKYRIYRDHTQLTETTNGSYTDTLEQPGVYGYSLRSIDTKGCLSTKPSTYPSVYFPYPHSSATNTIRQFGVVWYLQKAVTFGQNFGRFANGDFWVLATKANPITITCIEQDRLQVGRNNKILYSDKYSWSEENYWQSLATDKTNNSSLAGPYGYIDGGYKPGNNYQSCCVSLP